jgi:hypothetical protein
MKKDQELTVITKTYDLILWSCNHTSKFPRNHRFVLGERIERNLYTLLETLIRAKYARNKTRLLEELAAKTYRPGPYRTFRVYEGKTRLISAAPFRHRVVHHALTGALEPIFERSFIGQTLVSCGAGRSTINRRTSARRTVTGTRRRTVTRTTVSAPPALGAERLMLPQRPKPGAGSSTLGVCSQVQVVVPCRAALAARPNEALGPAGLVGQSTRRPRRTLLSSSQPTRIKPARAPANVRPRTGAGLIAGWFRWGDAVQCGWPKRAIMRALLTRRQAVKAVELSLRGPVSGRRCPVHRSATTTAAC